MSTIGDAVTALTHTLGDVHPDRLQHAAEHLLTVGLLPPRPHLLDIAALESVEIEGTVVLNRRGTALQCLGDPLAWFEVGDSEPVHPADLSEYDAPFRLLYLPLDGTHTDPESDTA